MSMNVNKFGKNAKVDNFNLQSGLKKEDLKTEEQKSIFNAVDSDGDGIINDTELAKFKEALDTSKDGVIDKNEAKAFLENNNLNKTGSDKTMDRKHLLAFLNGWDETVAEGDIQSATVVEQDGKELVKIMYKDGSMELVDKEKKTSQHILTDANGNTVITNKDANKRVTEQSVIKGEEVTTTTFAEDGETPTQTVTAGTNGTTTTVKYNDGKPATKEVQQGTVRTNYTIDADGNEVIASKVENEGVDALERRTEYTHNEDGSTTLNVTQNGSTTVKQVRGGKVQSETITNENGVTERTHTENGHTDVTTDANGNVTTTHYNSDGKRLSQTKVIDGKEYTVEYDGNGNTKVVLQNGESIQMLAKRFGTTPAAVKESNGGRIRGWAGDEVVVPGELDADDSRLQGRQTAAEAKAAYRVVAQEIEREKEQAAQRKEITQESKDETFEDLARSLFKEEGITPNKRQLKQRIEELKEKNPGLKDGELKGKKVKTPVAPEVYDREIAARKERERVKQQEKQRQEAKTGKSLAQSMYHSLDDNIGGITEDEFQNALKKVNKNNIVGVLEGYNKVSPDETLIEAIMDETYHTLDTRKDTIELLVNTLIARANDANITDERQRQLLNDCIEELDSYWSMGIGYCSTQKLDGLVKNVIGAIHAGEALTDSERAELRNDNAIDDTLNLMGTSVAENRTNLDKQLAEDGWCADLYEGLKWCVGSDNLDENVKADLNKFEAAMKALDKAQKTGGEAAFKTKFKELFGVEYDANLMKGYKKLQNNFANAQAYSMQLEGFKNEFGGCIKGTESYDSMVSKFGEFLKGTSPEITDGNQAVANAIAVAMQKDGIDYASSTEAQKKSYLRNIIKNAQSGIEKELNKYTNGKDLATMQKDLQYASTAVFGNQGDIVNRVNNYVASQQVGGAVVNGAIKAVGAIVIGACTFGAGTAVLAAASVATAVVSATVDLTDRASSDVGLKDGEVWNILKNATVDGASVFAGGQLAKAAMAFKSANAFVQAGGRLVTQAAGDIGVGVAGEYVQTGTITMQGVAFQAVFSLAGNLISIKSLGKADAPGGTPGAKGDTPDVPGTPGAKGDTPDVPGTPGAKGDTPDVPGTPGAKGDTPDVPGTPGAKGDTPDVPGTPGAKGDTPDVPGTPGAKGDTPDVPGGKKPVEPEEPVIVDPQTVREYYPTPSSEPVKYRNSQGQLVEVRTADDVREYLRSFNNTVSRNQMDNLVELYNVHPERFNRIANSGVFELIDNGYINRSTMEALFQDHVTINEHTYFTNRFLAEVKLAKSQLDQGIKPTLVKTPPKNAAPDWVNKNVRIGDVYEQNGKLFIRESNDTFTPLKLSKAKFDELFPPVTTAGFKQGSLGDCWLVSAIDNIMDYPQGRVAAFKLFEQYGDDIVVRLPGAPQAVPFPGGKVFEASGKQITGAEGIRMLEQACSVRRNSHFADVPKSPAEIAGNTNVAALMDELEGGTGSEAWNMILGKYGTEYTDIPTAKNLIRANANNTDNMLYISFNDPPNVTSVHREVMLEKPYHLVSNHAYAVRAYDPQTNMLYLSNPWNSAKMIEIPMDMAVDNLKRIQHFEFDAPSNGIQILGVDVPTTPKVSPAVDIPTAPTPVKSRFEIITELKQKDFSKMNNDDLMYAYRTLYEDQFNSTQYNLGGILMYSHDNQAELAIIKNLLKERGIKTSTALKFTPTHMEGAVPTNSSMDNARVSLEDVADDAPTFRQEIVGYEEVEIFPAQYDMWGMEISPRQVSYEPIYRTVEEPAVRPVQDPVVRGEIVDDVEILGVVEPEVEILGFELPAKTYQPKSLTDLSQNIGKMDSRGISKYLRDNNVEYNAGNGSISFYKNGVKYQIHHDVDGNIQGLRISDKNTGAKSYYGFDAQGNQTPITRDAFINIKTTTESQHLDMLRQRGIIDDADANGAVAPNPVRANAPEVDSALSTIDEFIADGLGFAKPSELKDLNNKISDLLERIKNGEVADPEAALNKLETLYNKAELKGQTYNLRSMDGSSVNTLRQQLGMDINCVDPYMARGLARQPQAKREALENVYNTVGNRVAKGEVPSKELAREVIEQQAAATGLNVDDLERSFYQNMQNSSTWNSVDFKRPKADIYPDKADKLVSQYKKGFGVKDVAPAPQRVNLDGTKGTFFTADELKFIKQNYGGAGSKMPDSISEVLDVIGKKIQQGEMPSYEMVRAAVLEVGPKHGVNVSQLDHNVLDCVKQLDEWKPISKYLDTPKKILDRKDPTTMSVETKAFRQTKGIEGEYKPQVDVETHQYQGIKAENVSASEIAVFTRTMPPQRAQMCTNILDKLTWEIQHGATPSKDLLNKVIKDELFAHPNSAIDPDKLFVEMRGYLNNATDFPDWKDLGTFFYKSDLASKSIIEQYPSFVTDFISKKKVVSTTSPVNGAINNPDLVSGGFFSGSKQVKLTPDAGWQNFDTTDGAITLVNSNGTVYLAKVGGGDVSKPVRLKPGEMKNLGKTPDGRDLMLFRDLDGSFSVRYEGSAAKSQGQSFFSRVKSTVTETLASVKASGDKQINRIINENLSIARGDASHYIGTPKVSQKLTDALNTTTLVKDLGDGVDLANISKHVEPGQVCSVGSGANQKLYVNNNGVPQEIKMSKEKFEELFPPTGFGLIKQGGYNNCWLVSRLNSMIDSPAGRAQIYSMFEETMDGDILVRLEGVNTPLKFPGGRPLSGTELTLGEGASQGVEMLQQAVLARNLRAAGSSQVSDISQLSATRLIDEANSLTHSDLDASKYLLKSRPSIITSNNPAYREKVMDALETFGRDNNVMISLSWEAHQRSIVGYDPNTRMVTYHDPYRAGVDMTCSVDELLRKNPNLFVAKTPNAGVQTPTKVSTVSSSRSASVTRPFESKSTALNSYGWREVSQTADGSSITARITQDGEIAILKNGKETRMPMLEPGDVVPIRETSTDTFIILKSDSNGRISAITSETEELPQVRTEVPRRPAQASSQTTTPSALKMPAGFKENGIILGRRSIIGPNNVVMLETKDGWKKLNA